MTEQALTQKEKCTQLLDYMGARRPQLENAMSEMAKKYMNGEKLVKLLLVAVSRQPKILECTPHSILLALMKAGECGLDPTGKGGQGHLVPFKNSKTQKLEAQFIPGYRGLVLNLMRTGTVLKVEAAVVFKGDHFDWCLGLNPRLEHIPKSISATTGKDIWDAIEAAYAIAWLPNGVTPTFKVVPKNDLIRIRNVAKAKADESPWQMWPDRMAMKTAVKQLENLLPIDSELVARTIEVDNEAESGQEGPALDLGEALVVEEKPSRTDELKDRLASQKAAEGGPAPKDDAEVGFKRVQAKILAVNLGKRAENATIKAARAIWNQLPQGANDAHFAEFLDTTRPEDVRALTNVGPKAYEALCEMYGVGPPAPEPESAESGDGAEAVLSMEAAENAPGEAEPATRVTEGDLGAAPSLEFERIPPKDASDPAYRLVGYVHAEDQTFPIRQHKGTGDLSCTCPVWQTGVECEHIALARKRLEEK